MKIDSYISSLKDSVFQVNTKWPQFQLLINDMSHLADSNLNKDILSLERNVLYGGHSLFSPLFPDSNYYFSDCSPKINLERGAYNKYKVDQVMKNYLDRNPGTPLKTNEIGDKLFDLIIVPNLLHHLPDLDYLFHFAKDHLAANGTLYIFDSTLREWHQIPDDFFRLTPFAIKNMCKKHNLVLNHTETTGSVFTALKYVLDQSIEFLPESSKELSTFKQISEILNLKNMLTLDELYRKNLFRPNSSFPTAYSCFINHV